MIEYENDEITKHSDIPMQPYHVVIRSFQSEITAAKVEITQMTAKIKYVRFKVTTCLYRNPNNKASSRSTLIAVNVNKDRTQKVTQDKTQHSRVSTNGPVFDYNRDPKGNTNRLGDQSDAKISGGQTTKQEFGRRMKGRLMVQSNKNQLVPQDGYNGEENI